MIAKYFATSLAVEKVVSAPQCRGLRLAAAFGHSFREIRKKQGDPEPEPNLKREYQHTCFPTCQELTQVDNRRQHAHDLDDEHDRVADQHLRVELAKRVPDRRTDDRRIEQGAHVALRVSLFHWLCLEFTRNVSREHVCLFSPQFRTRAGLHPPGDVPRRSK
ncbi:MAG: hypothetical protein ACREDM_06220 [Methylocella sp.]